MVFWTETKYNTLHINAELNSSDLDFLNPNNEYEFKFLRVLGRGIEGIVILMSMKIINVKKKIESNRIIAGKVFINKYNKQAEEQTIKDYILKLFYLKKILPKEKLYTIRLLNTRNSLQEQKNITFSFENKLFLSSHITVNLENIIFLEDFSHNNIREVLSFNEKSYVNPKLLSKGFRIRKRIYKKVIEDLKLLFDQNLSMLFLDLWLITFHSYNKFDIKMIDVSFLMRNVNVDIKKAYYIKFRDFLIDNSGNQLEEDLEYCKELINTIFK